MEKMKLQLPVLLLVSGLAATFALAQVESPAGKSKVSAATDSAAPQPKLAQFRAEIEPILKKSCLGCHGAKKQEGEFRIDTLDPDLLHGKDVDWWLEAFNAISNGEMPPEDANVKLADADRSKIIEWLSSEIQTASEVRRRQRGHSSFRRMTRYEYNYALQDLLGLPYDFARDLPPEASSDDGFQNSSEILHMTVVQFEMYRRLARKALLRATVRGPRPPVLYWGVSMKDAITREWPKQLEQVKKLKEKFKDDPARQKREVEQLTASFKKPHNNTYYQELSTGRTARADWAYYGGRYAFAPTDAPSKMPPPGDHVAILPRGKGLVIELGDRVPNEGTMRIRVRASQVSTEAPSLQLEFGWQASNEGRARMRVSTADTLVKGSPEAPGIYQWEIALGDIYPRNSVRNITKMGAMPSPSEYIRLMNSSVSQGDIRLDWVEVSTPVFEKWPPESHSRIFIDSKNRDNEDIYAREVLERFMRRAWRRNVTQAEVDQKFKLYKAIRPECENLEEAVVEVLAAVLSSPNLLYLVRTSDTDEAAQAAKTLRLSHHELATRLSMFLWCSTPDDKLLELAGSGELGKPGVLAGQVTRMLADDRSRRFSKHFVRQWLDMQLLDFLSADRKIHPQFDPGLKEAMQREPIAFFQEVLQENESVLSFIDADYTMVNERLARHYGIDGVLGNHFRRVKLDEKMDRGGLLTQAGLLAMNSAGADSHPLKRGIWLLESLLNDPPPPPPPAVPEIDLADPEIAKLTLKERIEDHRNHAACKSCHAKIDPWGIAFENYDAMGRWRNQVKGKPVDATSLLFNNQKLDGMTGLKRFLLENRQDQFARAMVHKMATYALGRPLTFGDYASVNRIAAELRKQEDGLATMVKLIVASDLFQSK